MYHRLSSVAILPFALLAFVGAAAATPDAKACSAAATAKGLHGAEREAFRATCMKAAPPAAAAKPAPPMAAKPATLAKADAKSCSEQATAKGLHGADREAFRSKCAQAGPASPARPAIGPAARPPTAPATRPAPVSTSSSAASQACSKQADTRGLHGADREAFRATCLKGGAASTAAPPRTVAAAKPLVNAAVPPEPGRAPARAAKPAMATGARSPGQLAADQRIHACGQQWQAAKAAGRIPAGQTWPRFWSACSTRLKASGR